MNTLQEQKSSILKKPGGTKAVLRTDDSPISLVNSQETFDDRVNEENDDIEDEEIDTNVEIPRTLKKSFKSPIKMEEVKKLAGFVSKSPAKKDKAKVVQSTAYNKKKVVIKTKKKVQEEEKDDEEENKTKKKSKNEHDNYEKGSDEGDEETEHQNEENDDGEEEDEENSRKRGNKKIKIDLSKIKKPLIQKKEYRSIKSNEKKRNEEEKMSKNVEATPLDKKKNLKVSTTNNDLITKSKEKNKNIKTEQKISKKEKEKEIQDRSTNKKPLKKENQKGSTPTKNTKQIANSKDKEKMKKNEKQNIKNKEKIEKKKKGSKLRKSKSDDEEEDNCEEDEEDDDLNESQLSQLLEEDEEDEEEEEDDMGYNGMDAMINQGDSDEEENESKNGDTMEIVSSKSSKLNIDSYWKQNIRRSTDSGKRKSNQMLGADMFDKNKKLKDIKLSKNIMMHSGLESDDVELLYQTALRLGEFQVETENTQILTHLIYGGNKRTMKLLYALAKRAWILDTSYLCASLEYGAWMVESGYECPNFQSKKFRDACGPLFKDMRFFFNEGGQQDFQNIKVGELKALVKIAGGRMMEKPEEADVIIEDEKNKKATMSSRIFEGNRPHIVSYKWVLDSLMKYSKINYKGYEIPV